MKTLYLWDLGQTLFPEKWNFKLTGFLTFIDYLNSIEKSFDKDPRDCVEQEKDFYIHGEKYGLKISNGFKEVLSWTRYNEAFTTGAPESLHWRAIYLNPLVGYDVESFFQHVFTTFEYGNTIKKTKEMFKDYLSKRYLAGYETVVFVDDNVNNCRLFKEGAEEIKGLNYRIYNILNDNNGLRAKEWYWEIGNLYDLLKNEQFYETN